MDKWFLITIFLTVLTSFFVIFTRVSDREEIKNNELSADDFEIID
jgi:hypothetical protein